MLGKARKLKLEGSSSTGWLLDENFTRKGVCNKAFTSSQNFVSAGRLQLTGSLQFAANLPEPGP
jgi:hypothetical protein